MTKLTGEEIIARKYLCIALDNLETADEIRELIDLLAPYVLWFKIGLETFHRLSEQDRQDILRLINFKHCRVFLDLKLHDIPNTVSGVTRALLERYEVDMLNVHASGGREMMNAAVSARDSSVSKPKIIAVTLLTSIGQKVLNKEFGIRCSVKRLVLKLACLARASGLDGIVCSAEDLPFLKTQEFPEGFMFITPGISGVTTSAGPDQNRVSTPFNAIRKGSNLLVIGRAITRAPNMEEEAHAILKEIARGIEEREKMLANRNILEKLLSRARAWIIRNIITCI